MAVLGMDTFPELTLRELIHMSKIKRQDEWLHTANLMCQQHNMHRKSGSPKAKLTDFYPFENQRSSGVPLTQDTFHMLKGWFGRGQREGRNRRDDEDH